MKPRLIVGAAGSGGHIFPALAFIEKLVETEPHLDVYVLTGEKVLEKNLLKSFRTDRILIFPLRSYKGVRSFFWPPFIFSLIRGFLKAFGLLKNIRPNLVIGFGGFHTMPLILTARMMGIRTLIHEQNAAFGSANKLLSLFATKTATAFVPIQGNDQKRFFQTGMPLRHNLRRVSQIEAIEILDLDPRKRTLLITGGSQGSRAINQAVIECLQQYGQALRSGWQFIHLSGKVDFESLKSFYTEMDVQYRLFSFYDDMSIIYACADLVLCRAGALTLHELAFFEKCAVLVPYPAAHDHQSLNARVLTDHEGAFLIEQARLDASSIFSVLKSAENNPEKIIRMGLKGRSLLKTDGSEQLVTESLSLIRNQDG